MNSFKKEGWLLAIAIVPFISLYLQHIVPKIINSWQMIFAFINLICIGLIIFVSIKMLVKTKKSFYLIDKIIVGFGFIYTTMLLLIVCSVLISTF